MTTIQVTAPCSARTVVAAARAPRITTATRTSYGQARFRAALTITTEISIVVRFTLRQGTITPIPTPLVCAVSWI